MLKERDVKDFLRMYYGVDHTYQFRTREDRNQIRLLMEFLKHINR